MQRNPPSRAGTLWTARGSRRRRAPSGSRWRCRSRRASGSSSRAAMSGAARGRPSWQRNSPRSERAYVSPNLYHILPHTHFESRCYSTPISTQLPGHKVEGKVQTHNSISRATSFFGTSMTHVTPPHKSLHLWLLWRGTGPFTVICPISRLCWPVPRTAGEPRAPVQEEL